MIINIDELKWLSGKNKISSYTKGNGFKSDFCSVCGSPVPNVMNIGKYMWIPAGLLEGSTDSAIAAHIHLDSKASWERDTENSERYSGGPNNIDEFINLLHGT